MSPDQQQSPGPGRGPSATPPKKGFLPRNPFLVIAMILAAIVVINLIFGDESRVKLNYSKLESFVMSMPVTDRRFLPPEAQKEPETETPAPAGENPGLIEKVTVVGSDLLGTLKPSAELAAENGWELSGDGKLLFSCRLPLDWEKSRERLLSRGIDIEVQERKDFSVILIWALPILFLVFILMMMFRSSRMTGENVLSFGRSRAKIVGEDKTGVTFDDVAGADEPKEELMEIVEFLKEPERFTALGGKIPKGCMLVGPPGCGKTLLARAVAGEAGVPFFSISGSDFVEMFVGVGAARVRDLFNTAKQKAPCIVFVDEIDAVGRHRGTGLGGGHDEREQTLNQLLVEMDGFDGRKGVIVVAATNRPDILDPALLRPGRFDRHVVLDSPDLKGREAILRIHSKDKPLADSVDLHEMAQRTPGFTGADLANVMNEAALLAARRRRQDISKKETQEAIERVIGGPERRSRIIETREKNILAYHELGHAIVARFSEGGGTVHKVSIIPRGKGLGYTLTLPDEDRYIITKDELLARIRMTLGGRSAEEVVFGHQSTGAADDLEKLSDLARSLVCRFGMTDELGPISYDRGSSNPFLGRDMGHSDHISDETAAAIDKQVRRIVDECHKEAVDILTANRELMDKLAVVLVERETLDRVEFEEAVQKHAAMKPPPLRVPLRSPDEDAPEVPDRMTSAEEAPGTPPEAPGENLPPPEPLGA